MKHEKNMGEVISDHSLGTVSFRTYKMTKKILNVSRRGGADRSPFYENFLKKIFSGRFPYQIEIIKYSLQVSTFKCFLPKGTNYKSNDRVYLNRIKEGQFL